MTRASKLKRLNHALDELIERKKKRGNDKAVPDGSRGSHMTDSNLERIERLLREKFQLDQKKHDASPVQKQVEVKEKETGPEDKPGDLEERLRLLHADFRVLLAKTEALYEHLTQKCMQLRELWLQGRIDDGEYESSRWWLEKYRTYDDLLEEFGLC